MREAHQLSPHSDAQGHDEALSTLSALAERATTQQAARRLASPVTTVEQLVCAECGRKPRQAENAADEWRAYLSVDDDLPVFCPECAEREFSES